MDGWLSCPNHRRLRLQTFVFYPYKNQLASASSNYWRRKPFNKVFWLLWSSTASLPIDPRSTCDALLRVSAHCEEVRALIGSKSRSIHIPRQAQPRFDCCGGIQLFLDLRKTFDVLPRPFIISAFERLPLSNAVFALLTAWHGGTRYPVATTHATRRVPVNRGVRQGCCAAPLIWACVVSWVLERLEPYLTMEWIQKCMTIFADDFYIACTFTSEEQLHQTLRFVGLILDTLTQMGFILNQTKSSVLRRGSGARFVRWKKQHLVINKNNVRCLSLAADSETFYLPVAKKVSLSWLHHVLWQFRNANIENADCHFRDGSVVGRKCMWSSDSRSWPPASFHASPIWNSLRWHIALPGLQQLCAQITAMYRRVLGNMAHVTGMTHADFSPTYSLRSPIAIIRDLWTQATKGLTDAV